MAIALRDIKVKNESGQYQCVAKKGDTIQVNDLNKIDWLIGCPTGELIIDGQKIKVLGEGYDYKKD